MTINIQIDNKEVPHLNSLLNYIKSQARKMSPQGRQIMIMEILNTYHKDFEELKRLHEVDTAKGNGLLLPPSDG